MMIAKGTGFQWVGIKVVNEEDKRNGDSQRVQGSCGGRGVRG